MHSIPLPHVEESVAVSLRLVGHCHGRETELRLRLGQDRKTAQSG